MVEFALVLPILMALLLGSIEISRYLNVYVTANRLAHRASMKLAEPDITASRSPVAAIHNLRLQLRDRRNWDEWNSGYGPLIMAMQRSNPDNSWVEADVNHDEDQLYYSTVRVVMDLPPLVIPPATIGGKTYGRMRMTGRGIAMNEMQAVRRDLKGPYAKAIFPLATILQHPEDPLPELPAARRAR
jgi:hypothetical protein